METMEVKQMETIEGTTTLAQAVDLINDRLAGHPFVTAYGRWHAAPAIWTDADINIDAGYADPSSEHTSYYARFAEIAATLRTQGHVVEDRGSSLCVYRRGSDKAIHAAEVQATRAGIQPGDIVVLSHNIGVECRCVARVGGEFLYFEKGPPPMTRSWVTDVLRTDIPVEWFRRTPPVHWIKAIGNGTAHYFGIDYTYCLSQVFVKLADETPRQFTLSEYSSNGGPGELISELGTFTVYRVGMQVFVERVQ
jgi:hypothetical protein